MAYSFIFLVKIGLSIAFYSQYLVTWSKYLVPWPKCLGPSLPKIQNLHYLPKSSPKILIIFGLLALFWHIFSILAKYLPFAANIWSPDPNIWVHTCQIYNIWHPLTKSFPKIYTFWGQNGKFPYLCLTSAVQFPTSHSQIWVKIV